jgi:ABC-type glycerol-3-phosphate transport system substrate-binding protein
MHRRSIAVSITALALASGLALSACSSSSSAGDNGGSTTVSYMTWESTATNAAIDATMHKFSASSGIKVKREQAPNADYAQKLASMIMSKKAPDFFWCTTAEARNLAAEGLLYDWTSHLDKGDGLKAANFSPGSLDLWKTPDGKVFGIPTLANTYGFFYNKAAFDKAGLAVPKVGWTWDDLFNDLAALKRSDSSNVPLVTQWPLLDSPQGLSAYSVANGGQPILDSFVDTKKVQADPTLRAGAKRFADAIKAGLMTNPDYDASNAMAKFANGGIALMFGGQWLQAMIAPNKPRFSWGYAPWPAGSSASVQPIETNGVCSPATLKHADATWKTISYMDSTGFNDAMRKEPIAPIAYEPGSKGYYAALQAGDPAAQSIAQTVTYELGAKDKFVTQFIGAWATKAADVVTTSWNPALEGKKGLNAGIDATVSGIQKLLPQ